MKELTEEKSQELAETIKAIAFLIYGIDLEYAKAVVDGMFQQANRQDTLAVLNPRYNPEKSNVLRLQAKALDHLVKYVECLKEAEKLKGGIANTDKIRSEIDKMFM